MNKWMAIAISTAVGAGVSLVYNYLFAPAPETKFDGSYQSRLDWALTEGERAAAQRELELRAEFEAAKHPRPALLPPPDEPLVGNSELS
jgi:hypothetical protein